MSQSEMPAFSRTDPEAFRAASTKLPAVGTTAEDKSLPSPIKAAFEKLEPTSIPSANFMNLFPKAVGSR
jgi:hypothetical protein